MVKIEIAPEFEAVWPHFASAAIQCNVEIEDSPADLIAEIAQQCAAMEAKLTNEDIHKNIPILDTRNAYKALGKEPSRYRPSAEALFRRVLNGKGLYHVNNVVDLLNLVSISTGFSIGGWDADQIEGDTITLGIGKKDEPYAAIGRGQMNIEFFPTFRDAKGAFGTPTSDSERTMITPKTKQFLMLFYGFGGKEGLFEASKQAVDLLEKYGNSKQSEDFRIQTQIPL